MILESGYKRKACTRLVLCTGKVYYDLKKMQMERKLIIHLVRIEQLYPSLREIKGFIKGLKHLSSVNKFKKSYLIMLLVYPKT